MKFSKSLVGILTLGLATQVNAILITKKVDVLNSRLQIGQVELHQNGFTIVDATSGQGTKIACLSDGRIKIGESIFNDDQVLKIKDDASGRVVGKVEILDKNQVPMTAVRTQLKYLESKAVLITSNDGKEEFQLTCRSEWLSANVGEEPTVTAVGTNLEIRVSKKAVAQLETEMINPQLKTAFSSSQESEVLKVDIDAQENVELKAQILTQKEGQGTL